MKNFKCKQCLVAVFTSFVVLMTYGTGISGSVDYSKMSKTELQKKVASFNLGFEHYILGKELTAEQQEIAKNNNEEKAYPGTIKFKDKDIFVIVDGKSNVVIAMYKRDKEAEKADFKQTIGALMMQYGEPTAEAHGDTIYWNYGEDGFISQELYRAVKKDGQLESLIVLATIKFSSSKNVDTMTATSAQPLTEVEKKVEQSDENITSDNYVMIQSDMLTKKYLNK